MADSFNTLIDQSGIQVSRLLKNDSKISNKLRKLSAINDFAERKPELSSDDILENYETAINDMQKQLTTSLRERGLSPKEIDAELINRALAFDNICDQQIVLERMEQSKDTNWFVNQWVKHDGTKAKLVKGGILFVGGAVIGTGGAFIGLGLTSVAASAAAGAAVGVHVSRRRAKAIGDDGLTIAQRQANEDIELKHEAAEIAKSEFDEKNPDATGINPIEFTNITEKRTDDEMRNNRLRVKASAAAAGLGAKAAGLAFNLAGGKSIFSADSTSAKAPTANNVAPDTAPKPPVAEAIKGQDFTINSGDGFTNTLQHFASANGHNLSPSQSYDLHKAIVKQFGPNYIKGHDVYQMAGGDYGIKGTGSGSYIDGVAKFANDWITNNAK